MSVDKEDVKELTEHFDERYVRQNDCNDRQEKINKRFSNYDTRIALVDHRLKAIEKIAWIIAGAVVSQLVISFFSLFR